MKSLNVLSNEEEKKKAKLREEHKKKLLEESKFPSRMEDDIKRRPEKEKEKEKLKQELEKDNTFKPKIKKDVPNFKELQESFKQELDQKKNSFIATKPEGFSFSAPKPVLPIVPEPENPGEDDVEEVEVAKLPAAPKKPPAADSINKFLVRNFAPTEQTQLDAKKALAERNTKKIEDLKKQTENAKSNNEDLIRKVTVPKDILEVVKDKKKAAEVFKPKYDPRIFDGKTGPEAGELGQEGEEIDLDLEGVIEGPGPQQEGMFTVEAAEVGDQALPGMAPQPRPKPQKQKVAKLEPPKLFSKETKVETKKPVDPNRKTKIQLETEKMKEDKQKQLKKEKEEEEKAQQQKKEREKQAAQRVRFKLAEEGLIPTGEQALPNQPNKVQEVFNKQTKEFVEKKAEMDKRVDKKACLVEESMWTVT